MKLTMYIDVDPRLPRDWKYFTAYANPDLPKPDNAKRYRFVIEVEDPRDVDQDLGEIPTEVME